ncbi:hypothetical protein EVAR_32176_1 [Eumeta japonica]|uniref:DUF5641 domain-containing protein n=1 Tax=Eumeta variegata TaxID=151549 RepID=A0A4C1VYC7_EUMVA|nr:hypothetical protein EVAR_32176_1 [Eumeta japonica]
MHTKKLQPFVRNRVAKILEKIGNHTWRHVTINKSPVDHIFRGVDPNAIDGLDLWRSDECFRVLLKKDNLPPLQWKLGRIVRLYSGADGINRMADIRHQTELCAELLVKFAFFQTALKCIPIERQAFTARGMFKRTISTSLYGAAYTRAHTGGWSRPPERAASHIKVAFGRLRAIRAEQLSLPARSFVWPSADNTRCLTRPALPSDTNKARYRTKLGMERVGGAGAGAGARAPLI